MRLLLRIWKPAAHSRWVQKHAEAPSRGNGSNRTVFCLWEGDLREGGGPTSSSSRPCPSKPWGPTRPSEGPAFPQPCAPWKGPSQFWGSAVIIQTAKLSILISMTNRQTSDHFLVWLANRVKNKLKASSDLCDSYTFHCTLMDGFIFLTSVILLVRICCPSRWKSDLT